MEFVWKFENLKQKIRCDFSGHLVEVIKQQT
jgi:hypothetical protein